MADNKVCPFLDRPCPETGCKMWTLHTIRKQGAKAPVTIGDCAIKWITATGFMRLDATSVRGEDMYDKFHAFLNQSEIQDIDTE